MVWRPEQFLTIKPNPSSADLGWAQAPHGAGVHSSTGVDLRWFGTLKFPSWDFQNIPLIQKGEWKDATDDRAYLFRMGYDNQRPIFSVAQASGVMATAAIPDVSDGRFIGLRVDWRSSDGRTRFWYSFDNGVSWTQIGSDVTHLPSSGTIPNRGDLYIGLDNSLHFTGYNGNIARAEFRDAAGSLMANPNFSDPGEWTLGENAGDTAVDGEGNTWTLRDGDTAEDPATTVVVVEIRETLRLQHVRLNRGGFQSDQITVPDDADFDDWPQLNITAFIRPEQVASGTRQTIAHRSDGTQSFRAYIDEGGELTLQINGNGTSRSATSTVSLDTRYSDGDWCWIRFEWFASVNRVRFYTSTEVINPFHVNTLPPDLVKLGDDINLTDGVDTLNNVSGNLVIGQRINLVGFEPFKGDLVTLSVTGPTLDSRTWFNFMEAGPWQVGDDGSRTDEHSGRTITLNGFAEVFALSQFSAPSEQGSLVLGDDFAIEIDLQSDATGGLILGAPFNVNPRIAGEARGELVFGGRFPQRYDVQAQGGLIIGSNFTIIPPEIVAGIGSLWSVGIGGVGYMLSTLDQEAPFEYRSYEIQAIPQQRPQIDDQDEPGEQTLFPWWSRAQHTWHEGAGQEIFDSPFSSRYRYCSSIGLDPWDTGEIKLHKDTALQILLAGISDVHLLGASNALFYTHDGNVTRDVDPDTAGVDTLATHDGTPINSIASDGEVLYAAFSGGSLGIKSTPLEGTLAWSDVNAQTDVDLIAFVKGRLIGAKGPSLYEYDLAVTTEPESFYNDLSSGWVWTSISESGPAIYASGYAGERSEIFAVRLTAQDIPYASVATLGAPVSVWTAPDGERVLSVKGYVGAQLLIGTSKGVRIGTVIPGSGELQVSPLLSETRDDHPRPLNVLGFEPQDDYAWFTWTDYDGTHTGLGRIHLGTLGWSSDLMYSGQGEVRNVVTYNGRRYFTVFDDPDSAVVKEHPTDLVETAQLDLCEIRFGTSELKILRYFDFRGRGEGSYAIRVSKDGGAYNPVINSQGVTAYQESVINVEGSSFKLRLLITRDSDPTQQFYLNEWRLRAEPRSTGRFRYLVPLMIYDHLTNLAEQEVGYTGYAIVQLEALVDLYRTGRDTLFQRLGTGVPGGPSPTLVIMEDLRFKSFTPPEGARGFGGIALAVLREVR